MANLQSIRKRISSVKNTQQLTRAMKMVAAARLRRVQDKVQQSRPFSGEILKMISPVISKTTDPESLSPFMAKDSVENTQQQDELQRVRVLVIASDRGLCGAYNSNIQKQITGSIQALTQMPRAELTVDVIGKHAYEYVKKVHPDVKLGSYHEGFLYRFSKSEALSLVQQYRDKYLDGSFNEFKCIYTEFKSVISQRVRFIPLLPITPKMILESAEASGSQESRGDSDIFGKGFLFEPTIADIAKQLVTSFLDSRFYQILLEAIASEHGARMTAMENATKNAKGMIEDLTLYYNQVRQAKITNELLDIVGGAEALR